MYTIVLNHFLVFGNAFRKFSKYKEQLNLLHIFTDWHNNGFALISGIVGYRSNKYSNLLYLWLTVFFYSVGIHLYIKIFKRKYIINYDFYDENHIKENLLDAPRFVEIDLTTSETFTDEQKKNFKAEHPQTANMLMKKV